MLVEVFLKDGLTRLVDVPSKVGLIKFGEVLSDVVFKKFVEVFSKVGLIKFVKVLSEVAFKKLVEVSKVGLSKLIDW